MKVFRLQNPAGILANLDHWNDSAKYDTDEINNIPDPAGMMGAPPTSIPTPFARMDMARNAFNFVCRNGLSGHTFYHRIVSDILDIAQIMFSYSDWQNDIRIYSWNKVNDINVLQASGSLGHNKLAETLNLYLNQDEDSFNFNLTNEIHIIEFKNQIIGGTSPLTLFFSTADKFNQNVQIQFPCGDIAFDGNTLFPLYQRDENFQKFIYALRVSMTPITNIPPNDPTPFNGIFRDLGNYLQQSLNALLTVNPINPILYNQIINFTQNDYDNIRFTSIQGGLYIINNLPYKQFIRDGIVESDYEISSNKIAAPKPLVLMNGHLGRKTNGNNMKYFDVTDYNAYPPVVPYNPADNINGRYLPGYPNIQYPWLTVNDFLEPYLIRLVFPVNDQKFFAGNLVINNGNNNSGYLLPLKTKFFEYFNTDDLLSNLPGTPQIEMSQGAAGSVRISLRIPVVCGEFINLERTYYEHDGGKYAPADPDNNRGVVFEHQFSITLFPFIKTNNPNINAYYRVQQIDRNVDGNLANSSYDLEFFSNSNNNPIRIEGVKTRSLKAPLGQDPATSKYYILNHEFDYIKVSNSVDAGVTGIIIPLWRPYIPGVNQFSFAVDFGTTNTHIEYQVNGGPTQPFDITPNDIQIATLFHPDTTTDFYGSGASALRMLIDFEFVPEQIGHRYDYKFPHRTVIANNRSLNFIMNNYALADFNIPFIYERKPTQDDVVPNLKWAVQTNENDKRIHAYLEEIIMLIRNKVLLNNGNLANTRLFWFYPSSMTPARINTLDQEWQNLFHEYINPASNPENGIMESLAPFYYFRTTGIAVGGAATPAVTIDIGGGTTDVVVFQKAIPQLLSSFRFAANTIFGDAFYNNAAANNGLVVKYMNYYVTKLNANRFFDPEAVLNSIYNGGKTQELMAFFFSLENNPQTKENVDFSFNLKLSNEPHLKIVFLYFYSAIIYHIAEMMKSKGIDLPQHLIFSGTGSKILKIITPNNNTLADFSKIIFERVYNINYTSYQLSILTEDTKPKEVTCIGGLTNPNNFVNNPDNLKYIYTCLQNNQQLQYNKITPQNKNDLIAYIMNFNNFFIGLNNQLNFHNHFGVSPQSFNLMCNNLNKNLNDYLANALNYFQKIDAGTNNIEESWFFYPLVEVVYRITTDLCRL